MVPKALGRLGAKNGRVISRVLSSRSEKGKFQILLKKGSRCHESALVGKGLTRVNSSRQKFEKLNIFCQNIYGSKWVVYKYLNIKEYDLNG